MNEVGIAGSNLGEGLLRLGGRLLTVAFWSSIVLVAAASWFMPRALPFLPLILLAVAAAWFLFQRPALNLCLVILGLSLVADFEEGVEVKEVIFGLYLVAFLVHWYFRRIFLERHKLLESTNDRLMMATLVMVIVYVPISFLFGTKVGPLRSEFVAMTTLAFYFPAKEVIKEDRRAVYLIFLALLGVGLYVTLRNVFWLRDLVSEARVAWQITQKGRVISNEILLVVPASAMLAWTLQLRRWRSKALFLTSFLAMVTALVITQSRGFWLAFALGCLVLLIAVERRQRIELVTIGIGAVVVSLLFVFLFFRDTALLLLAGMFNRVLSLGSAVTKDISLINRFLESRVVWERILDNPILGYGLGVPYRYFNLTIGGTRVGSFIHNGYLALWYRFGLFGALLIIVLWGRSLYHAAKLTRKRMPGPYRMAALTALTVLSAMLVSNLTSNAFFHMDSLFMFAVVTGMTEGVRQGWLRNQMSAPSSP